MMMYVVTMRGYVPGRREYNGKKRCNALETENTDDHPIMTILPLIPFFTYFVFVIC